jgi:hypothetical protein
MNKTISTGLTAVLCATAFASFAQTAPKEGTAPPTGSTQKDGMGAGMGMTPGAGMKMGMDPKTMDSNGDGMISKDEFMKHHEAMFDKMKKGTNGMVSLKDWETAHSGMK